MLPAGRFEGKNESLYRLHNKKCQMKTCVVVCFQIQISDQSAIDVEYSQLRFTSDCKNSGPVGESDASAAIHPNMIYQSPMDIDEAATLRLLITLIGLTLLRSQTMTLPLLLDETTTSHVVLMASAVIGA
jgi:hypothetical protein